MIAYLRLVHLLAFLFGWGYHVAMEVHVRSVLFRLILFVLAEAAVIGLVTVLDNRGAPVWLVEGAGLFVVLCGLPLVFVIEAIWRATRRFRTPKHFEPCPECNRRLSPRAHQCPYCGCQLIFNAHLVGEDSDNPYHASRYEFF